MARPATPIELSNDQRKYLEKLVRQPKAESRYVERARMILWACQGMSNLEIARRLDTRPARVSKWRTRFAQEGLDGLCDDFRPGVAPRYDKEQVRNRILKLLDEDPPIGYTKLNGRLLAERLGDVSADQVWRQLRSLGISLQRRRSWCVSTDPEFTEKAADIVGLYLAPPENAVVLCVDEKPCIQALERAQGWLKLPNGRALSGFAHEYKRNGTTTLFGALEVATGRALGSCKARKRRKEFIEFIEEIEEAYPSGELHIILDNLSSHKIKDPKFWKEHPRLHFHFTPTHASWMNQIEAWFSILSRSALKGGSFSSVPQLIEAIESFVETYNQTCHPFQWTKIRVEPKSLESKYANLSN